MIGGLWFTRYPPGFAACAAPDLVTDGDTKPGAFLIIQPGVTERAPEPGQPAGRQGEMCLQGPAWLGCTGWVGLCQI